MIGSLLSLAAQLVGPFVGRLVRRWFCPSDEEELNDQRVTFTTKNPSSYGQFIKALRAKLASGEKPHGIPVMRERSTVPDYRRFILVELSNLEADSITLAVDVTNAYVVAYRTGSRSFFLREHNPDPAIDNLFPDTERYTFPFSGSYTDLERVAGKTRKDIELGMLKLGLAIGELRISNLKQQKSLARSLIVVIQMVAEAVRFKTMENLVCDSFGSEFKPNLNMLNLENNWGAMSREIQRSNQVGVDPSPVAIMLFVRRSGQPAIQSGGESFQVQLNYVLAAISPCTWIAWLIHPVISYLAIMLLLRP